MIPLVRLNPPVAVIYQRIDGKRVGKAELAARLTALSPARAEVEVDERVALRDNLRLVAGHGTTTADAYAKVFEIASGGAVIVLFTSVSSDWARIAAAWLHPSPRL